jgi:hypothetical protein
MVNRYDPYTPVLALRIMSAMQSNAGSRVRRYMNCRTCQQALVPGRLFCVNCGTVTPEGMQVMRRGEEPTVLAQPTPSKALNAAALVSFGFGLLAYIAVPVVGAIVAVVFGHIARREIQVAGGTSEGRGLATTGMVLGYLQLGLIAFAFLVVAAVLVTIAAAV